MKKFIALLMAMAMLQGMVPVASAEELRHIVIATTWDIYLDSTHESIEDNPGYGGSLVDQMMWENVKIIEEKYNVTFEFVNMLYGGVQESINTSILAGTPDADCYMIGLAVAAPAVANGYVLDLREVLPSDHPVITGEDPVLSWVDTGNGSVSLLTDNNKEDMVANTYPLSFNLQMIEEVNLEDPRDLAARGEWTWDVFLDYCIKLTKDTDGDGVTDVYGFGGWPEDYLNNMGIYPDWLGLVNGDYTVAQFQETYKQQIQDGLDRLMGN